MPRPPNPLTEEEQAIIRRFVGYDSEQDLLVWLPRDPEDFGTRDPQRTAAGFNRGKAGQRIALTASNQFSVKTLGTQYVFTENKVRAFLGAPHRRISTYSNPSMTPQGRTIRHPHARGSAARNTNPDGNMFDRSFIKTVIEMGPDKVLRWRKLPHTAAARAMLEDAVRERLPSARYEQGDVVSWRSLKAYNARVAGTEVKVTTSGVVRLLRAVLISPFLLEQIFSGCRIGVTDPNPPRRKPVFTEADMRRYVGRGASGVLVWKARGAAEWFGLVMLEAAEAVPDAGKIAEWNELNVGYPVPLVSGPNRPEYYRIGTRTIGVGKMHRALAG